MTAPTSTTLLEAVNTCLAAIGEAPVNTTTTTDSISVVHALQFINEVSKEMQNMSWGFNSDTDYEMARDVDLKIPVTSNIIRIDSTKEFAAYDVVYRAGFLYDKKLRSFTFDRNIKCDVTWLFPFDELPEVARWYITVTAARKLQARKLSADARELFNAEDQARAWTTLKEAEGDTTEYNMFNASYSVASILERYPSDPYLF